MKNALLIMSLVLLLTGCQDERLKATPQNPYRLKVEKVLNYDGCTLYHANIEQGVYWSKCENAQVTVNYTTTQRIGKSTNYIHHHVTTNEVGK